jgi:hypothetical protein
MPEQHVEIGHYCFPCCPNSLYMFYNVNCWTTFSVDITQYLWINIQVTLWNTGHYAVLPIMGTPLLRIITNYMEHSPSGKQTVAHLAKKLPIFYGTQSTRFTTACHWTLSWASLTESTPWHPIYLRSVLILSFHLYLVSQLVSFLQTD